jgi:hypothetical protein
MPVEKSKPAQLELFTDGVRAKEEQRLAALRGVAERGGFRERLDRVLDAASGYSHDFHPNLKKDTLEVLERSAKLDSSAFDAIVDALDFAAAEHKLPQALAVVPSGGGNLREQVATMRQLRRLGLPLTKETIGISAKVLEGCDPALTRYQPSGDNPGCMREIYYRLLAYNSAAEIPANAMESDGRVPKLLNAEIVFLVYRNHPEAFPAIATNLPPERMLTPPDDRKLDDFLLSLPNFTAETVHGTDAYGHPLMSREKKLGIWFSRVKAVGRPIREDRQGRFDFGE